MSTAADVPPSEWVASNRSAVAVAAPEPAEADHYVVVPRRKLVSWSDAADDERDDLWALVQELRDRIAARGTAARISLAEGPGVTALEIHVMPATAGTASEPTGGAVSLVDAVDGRFLRLELVRSLRDHDFDRIDLLVSFIMKSGLELVWDRLEDAVERGARVRVLTTDYLHVTDADALSRLLDLSEGAEALPGALEVRVFSDPLTSFHPKAYLFHSSGSDRAVGFVGSSNLSRSGIDAGVEWSLGTAEVGPLVAGFDHLWNDHRSRRLTHEFLRTYRTAWRPTAGAVVPVGVETEPPAEAPAPRPLQAEALDALAATRADGYRAGMVVMATGLGKTWLAAFDSAAGFGRTLFVAHREEILRQSRDVFRRVRPDAELGLFTGAEKQPDADVVFASVQTLHRHLATFDPDEFDYVVVDEFHHADAATYRKVLDHFRPRFLLGLTATPERMDGADLLALCGDNLVFECGLVEGIDRSELVPFRYWGIKDVADYEGIPWRSGRFDAEMLAGRIETRQRAQQAFDEWEERCGERTLGFCASVSHAEFMAAFFVERRVRAVAVHSAPGSADRRDALERLRHGDLDVVFAVDMFNEGVDVPEIDSVLMLRPTESPVVFLQQLGRGLRLSEGKDHLRVVDFVGNHRSFLLHPRVLLGMAGGGELTNARILRAVESGEWDLPAGCSVTFDVEAIDLLRLLARRGMSGGDALEQFCLDFAAEHEARPTAAQAAAAGYNPRAARAGHGGWFGLLDDLGLLGSPDAPEAAESRVWGLHRDVLAAIEKESVTKAYKLVALKALLSAGALRSGMAVAELAARSQAIVAADPRLVADAIRKEMPSPGDASPEAWERFWRKWPLEHLTTGSGGTALFRFDGDRFVPAFSVAPELGDAFDAMVAELVEWRLGDYLLRNRAAADGAIRCKVSHSSGAPIVRFDRARNPGLPEGDTSFTADGEKYVGRFVKIALNVAALPGEDANVLPELLRDWFGADAGHAGTNHHVLLEQVDNEWVMRPDVTEAGNPLARFVGQRFRREDVPALFELEFNPGNWNSGHVSLPDKNAVVLFVTLTKSGDMPAGADYSDQFESPDILRWSSQTKVGPDSKKGREILGASERGTVIHLFTRDRKRDGAFEYRGPVVPLDHAGSEPMHVRLRLLD